MAFGLTDAPNTFQGAMNNSLKPLPRKCALVFFDDILVYSRTLEEHIEHLRQVFTLLARDQWKVKFSKCRFAQQSISYLGHVVSHQGVSTDPEKMESIQAWPQPQDIKELRSFLGLAGYYRKFVQNFVVLARPLTKICSRRVLSLSGHRHILLLSAL